MPQFSFNKMKHSIVIFWVNVYTTYIIIIMQITPTVGALYHVMLISRFLPLPEILTLTTESIYYRACIHIYIYIYIYICVCTVFGMCV